MNHDYFSGYNRAIEKVEALRDEIAKEQFSLPLLRRRKFKQLSIQRKVLASLTVRLHNDWMSQHDKMSQYDERVRHYKVTRGEQ